MADWDDNGDDDEEEGDGDGDDEGEGDTIAVAAQRPSGEDDYHDDIARPTTFPEVMGTMEDTEGMEERNCPASSCGTHVGRRAILRRAVLIRLRLSHRTELLRRRHVPLVAGRTGHDGRYGEPMRT